MDLTIGGKFTFTVFIYIFWKRNFNIKKNKNIRVLHAKGEWTGEYMRDFRQGCRIFKYVEYKTLLLF